MPEQPHLINLHDFATLAQTQMEHTAWDYYEGGSDDEVTLRANQSAFARIRLRPRVLVDCSHLELSTTVLGTPVSLPVLIAPTAYHCLAHPEGECATVQGAGAADTLMIVSTFSTRSMEEIIQIATGPLWFQLYMYRDLKTSAMLVHRAEAAGYKAIVLTVDTPILGKRERDLRNNFTLPSHLGMANIPDEHIETYIPLPLIPTWETVDWLRTQTSLPILLKGILTAEDAELALQHGVSGIIVSNHGGRQLDTVLSGIEALPEVVASVNGRCEVYVDGGIRRGTDILKALALGARAVLVGRPILWGLAVNGASGVQHILDILRAELEVAMSLAGRPTLTSIDRSLVTGL